MLWRIFGPKRDDVKGEWKRLHNEEIYALYFSSNILRVIKSRRIRLGEACSTHGEERCIRDFGGDT